MVRDTGRSGIQAGPAADPGRSRGHCSMADCSRRLASAAIPTEAKDDTQLRSSALAAPGPMRFIPRADGSAWQGHHSVPNTDRWTLGKPHYLALWIEILSSGPKLMPGTNCGGVSLSPGKQFLSFTIVEIVPLWGGRSILEYGDLIWTPVFLRTTSE